ncbi:MAG TPA: archease [Acidimicrobiales bacterium]|nr:archease [Acidimicrobiales bacterium]
MEMSADRGHAIRPHTADAVIEAWGPTAAACYEEAVAAFVDIFAETDASPPGSAEAFDVGPGRPGELLVLLLEEVLFDAEARGHVPTVTEVEVRDDRLVGRFSTVSIEELDITGAIPKGVSYSDLEFGATESGWHCRAMVDV